MARTGQLRAFQIGQGQVTRGNLRVNFLEGAVLDLTNGANDATIAGLREAVNPTEPVVFSQFLALQQSIAGGVQNRMDIPGNANLTGNSTGNTYADGSDGYMAGDKFLIASTGSLVVSDGVIPVNVGDAIMIRSDIASDSAIAVADVFKIDNTESADLLRESDIVDDLSSVSVVDPLSANQGMILGNRIAAIEALGVEVFGETPTITAGQAVVTAANTPIVGTLRVYRNGQRLCPAATLADLPTSDYFANGTSVTFSENLEADEVVILDYRR